MNNADFKALLSQADGSDRNHSLPSSSHKQLGSCEKQNILMMPRSVRTAQPSSSHDRAQKHNNSTRKRKSTAAPKGTALAAGYIDRTLVRRQQGDAEEEDDRARQLKALEEQLKSGEIDQETFQRLSADIVGGDINSTHLVKGLDRKLLERARRGENVWVEAKADAVGNDEREGEGRAQATEEELELLATKEFEQVQRESEDKRGGKAAQTVRAGVKRSRNDIIAELKAQRKDGGDKKSTEGHVLSSKFRRLDSQTHGSRLEIDGKGREVLITIDENGKEKRKVRKAVSTNSTALASVVTKSSVDDRSLQIPTHVAEEIKRKQDKSDVEDVEGGVGDEHSDEDDDDDDIFKDAGHDYNPLGISVESGGSSASESEIETDGRKQLEDDSAERHQIVNSKQMEAATEGPSSASASSRNYFGGSSIPAKSELDQNPFADPTILASFKRASELSKREEARDNQEKEEGRAARKALEDRDFEDMDMGFGSSRFDDEEDENGPTKFSEWKGIGATGDEEKPERGRGGQGLRKRGKKKRKGDKNSASDVLRVIEGRQKN